jgi:predicted dienelactone hydrolase
MSLPAYRSEMGGQSVRESGEVLAGHAVLAGHPLTCRWPEGRPPVGFVVFCHGLGSDGGDYAALSRCWARQGYLVIHPTFSDAIAMVAAAEPALGLDPAADLSHWATLPDVRARMHEILHAPEHRLERVALVGRVMDALGDICAATTGRPAGPFPGAIAGHSFGAYTAQLLAGAEIDMPGGAVRSFHDARFGAAILLSAQGRDQQGLRDGSWDAMRGPVLTVTGTRDQGAKGGDWHWKSEPFDLAPVGAKYLAVLDEGDHYLGGFSDRMPARDVPAQQDAVRQITSAFLDAHLRDRPGARDWLGQISDSVGDCRLRFRRK